MRHLKLGSLFDGIGGFPYSAARHGITPVWASEIEPVPISITKRHFPNIKHLGDICGINGAEIEPVDIITFGSPCQDLSVAGKRAGLDGSRSGLLGEAIRIINEMRENTSGKYPKYAIWENVPGALPSNGGHDFKTVLEAFAETEIPIPASGRWAGAGMVRGGRCDIAWRILDAQFWGVPQRRRRIFLVADFAGRRAGKVLFEPESLRGDFAESSEAREGIAGSISGGVEAANDNTRTGTDGVGRVVNNNGTQYLTGWDVQDKRIFTSNGVAPTLCGADGGGGRNPGGQVFDVRNKGNAARPDVACTLAARGDSSPCVDRGQNFIACTGVNPIIRRLTPVECERLQGFPDNWTAFGHDGKAISDTARYKALGNSVAAPCVDYIMMGLCGNLDQEVDK